MTPRERADRAKDMLESEIFQYVHADMRDRIIERMEACAAGDHDTQHVLFLMLQLHKQYKTDLIRYTDVIAIDKAKEKRDAWLRKAKQHLMP
jgi:hypothetical protein